MLMDDPADTFITQVTLPLAGNEELHLAAVTELRDRLAEPGAGDPAALTAATAALAQADAHPRRWRWQTVLGVITGVVSLPLLVAVAVQYLGGLALIKEAMPRSNGRSSLAEWVSKGRSPAERLLLVGADTRKEDARWRPLWESAPDKPAYLAEYALAVVRTQHELSPEILETANRIDPDNGWFPTLAAAGMAEGVVKKGTRSGQDKREGKAIVWQVVDEPKLREALLQLHRAATLPRFTGYRTELHRERAQLLPPCADFISCWVRLAYAARIETSVVYFRHLGDALAAGAGLCAERQDVEGFRQILDDWRWLTSAVVREGDTLIDQLVARALITAPLANFREAARKLGMTAAAERFTAQEQLERTEQEARERNRTEFQSPLARQRGSLLAGLTMLTPSVIKSPPVVTEPELRPGRLADHAVFDRASAVAMWGVLAFGVGLMRWGRAAIRAVARRLVTLAQPGDWAWILLGGVVAPVLWHLAITRLTPLSARDWSLGASGFLLPVGQKCALLLLLLIAPLVLSGWRFGKRCAGLGFAVRWPWFGWLAVLAAALALPGLGAVVTGPVWWFQSLAAVLLGWPVCWLLAVMFNFIAGEQRRDLWRATVVRLAVPAWCLGMLLCCLALPLHEAEERYWIRQDTLSAMPMDHPAISSFEARLVLMLQAETQALLTALKPTAGE